MVSKSSSSVGSAAANSSSGHFMKSNKKPTQEALNLKKALLDAYDQASRVWLARVKSEVDLWSELARKLTESRSAPEV